MPRTAPAGRAGLSLAWATDGRDVCLVVGGWHDGDLARLTTTPQSELARLMPVYPTGVVDAGATPLLLQPIAGRYSVSHDGVRFVPRFPFLAATSYSVLVFGGLDEEPKVLSIRRPAPAGDPTTTVVEVFPTATSIPRNQLRLYVYFSAPMAEGDGGRCVRVVRDDTGETVGDPFTPTDPELWDPARRRLTVLFDPARIKRGLRAHREVGYPLEEGVAVRVVIDESFRDSAGRSLAQGFERRYDITPDERRRVDPSTWDLDTPTAGTTVPLTVRFDRALDHGLLQHCLTVVDAEGRPLEGAKDVERGERDWTFHPASPWAGGPHRLLVDPILEDGAGNSVRRVFDREVAVDEPSIGPTELAFVPEHGP